VKDYIIQSDIILWAEDIQKFTRPETKLILNNSNEEVFLRDVDWEIIDSVIYETSQKWKTLIFEKKIIIPEIPEVLISDEAFISWEVLISDEVLTNPPSSDHNTVPLIKGEDETQWSRGIIAPEIIISLQRPSYITQSGSSDIYVCDKTKEECKVNFDMRDSFTETSPEKDYECLIDFGIETIIFWEEQKCNPNTVIFPEWEFELIFRIIHEDDSSIFSEKRIIIEHFIDEAELNSPGSDDNSIPLIEGEAETEWINVITAPEIIIDLQRPSYITQSGSSDIYVCDNSKEACNVNFDVRGSFTDTSPERDYVCEIDFWFWHLTWEEEKCNPNTIIFPEWIFEVIFQIHHEDDSAVISQKSISVINTGFKPKISTNVSESASDWWDITPRIHVWRSNFIVQSWLSWEWYEYECLKEPCKINLKYTPKYKDEKCFWNFAWGIYSHPMTLHKCNPSYVELPKWVNQLSLKVYDSNYEDNFIIFPFTVYPKSEKILLEEWWTLWEENTQLIENIQWEISAKINLQWKLSKEKSLSWSTLACSWVEKCYANLEGIIEWNKSGLKYLWKLDDEVFSEKLNPGWIWVEWEWTHIIIFKVWDIEKSFQIIIEKDVALLSSKGEEIQDRVVSWKETKLDFTQNFLVLKYDGLRISGKAPVWSKIEIYNQWEKIISWEVDEKWKYRLVSKYFKPWEYSFDTKIILASWEEIFLETSWEFILKPEKRTSWFIVKKAKTTKRSSKSSSTKVSPKLVVKDNIVGVPEVSMSLSFWEKIIFITSLLLLWIIMLLHMILKTNKIISSQIFSIYLQQFSVKHKVTLILP
jgi:hypothetical protein